VDFEIVVQHTDESFPPDLSPEHAAVHIARNKALAVQQERPSRTILAADTIVVLRDEIIGKPKDREDAISILSRLSGQQHQVITGVVILSGAEEHHFADVTQVAFHHLTGEQVAFYVDKYKPFDKAGAYAIQEWIGVVGIKKVDGDFYNVMGLPVSRVVQTLAKL
jgi:septum formation protein